MILPEPKDLPPRAAVAARNLTTDIENLNKNAQQVAEESLAKLNYTSVTLQNLSEQVKQMETLVNTLPGANNITTSQVTNFVVNTSYTTMTSFVVNVPVGYTQSSLVVIGTGILNDPTTPYMTDTNVRIGINGVYPQAVSTSWAMYWPTGATDVFHLSATETVMGTSPITITIQAAADQTIQASTSTFCRLTAFTLFSQ